MSDKEIRTMDRVHLLNVLRQLELEVEDKNKQIETLTSENDAMTKQLEDRQISLEKAGSLAEASILVSGVIQAAQEAADVYLANIKRLEAEKMATASTSEAEIRLKIDGMMQEAERKRKEIEIEAMIKADAIIKDAEHKRDTMEYEEKKRIEDLQNVSKQYMEFIDKAHLTLHDMIQKYKLLKLSKVVEPSSINTGTIATGGINPNILANNTQYNDIS